ncbi:GspH/FimT family pseudopilin [Cupriavidus sp. AU9028]|uniref:GspH/FimT family pseudopilin n=1 Tax=Cupriavidus sp. AU9028 TaxID=2871157 RepID=UPI001C95430F|nr:GspH/FimT family pseudopilin [Cupriavidus sp. AU9028]MBY4898991.1 GspH/FimT family pseudopilin [Cupriavidus sp. AU9028]
MIHSGPARRTAPPCTRRAVARGFTLLELLVVMVLAGIVVSMVAINATPNERSRVVDDGQRMARLFELAQEEAQLRARPIAWEADPQGWRFMEATPNGWALIRDDVFAPDRWSLPLDQVAVTAGAAEAGPMARLVFGREWIDAPRQLLLVRGNIRVAVEGDGAGRYFAVAR